MCLLVGRGELYLFAYLLSAQTGHTRASNSVNLLHVLENASFSCAKKKKKSSHLALFFTYISMRAAVLSFL